LLGTSKTALTIPRRSSSFCDTGARTPTTGIAGCCARAASGHAEEHSEVLTQCHKGRQLVVHLDMDDERIYYIEQAPELNVRESFGSCLHAM
jgi:hypothetical protein